MEIMTVSDWYEDFDGKAVVKITLQDEDSDFINGELIINAGQMLDLIENFRELLQ